MSKELHPSLGYLESQKGGICEVPQCGNAADRHHLQEVGMGRNRKKPMMEHYLIGRLCRNHHVEYDQIGERIFSAKYNVNLWKWAAIDLARWLWRKNEEV